MHVCAGYRACSKHVTNLCIACRPFTCSISLIIHVCIIHVTIVLGDLCDNIGLVGVSAKWSYVTASPNLRVFFFFYKKHIVYHNVYCGMFIEQHVYSKFRLDWFRGVENI